MLRSSNAYDCALATSDTCPVGELEHIVDMLKVAAEYRLEAEVVWELCNTLREYPESDIGQATMSALSEWDL